MHRYIKNLNKIRMSDLQSVGGKNASLGELTNGLNELNIKCPQGYALTTEAYSDFIKENEIAPYLQNMTKNINLADTKELHSSGKLIREKILSSKLSKEIKEATSTAWNSLKKSSNESFSVAIRSSATAEDLPDASFAGQQDSYLNISSLDEINKAVLSVYASLFTDRAISVSYTHLRAHET